MTDHIHTRKCWDEGGTNLTCALSGSLRIVTESREEVKLYGPEVGRVSSRPTPKCRYQWEGRGGVLYECNLPKGHQPPNRHKGGPLIPCTCNWVRHEDENCPFHVKKGKRS